MSRARTAGRSSRAIPTHMGLWDKWVLGWADPLILAPAIRTGRRTSGQTSRTPKGTEDGVRVDLPDKVITLADPHSGTGQW